MKHSIYLFDFDGTLVNSMPYWSQKMINVLEKSKVNYPEDIIKIITPLGDKGTAEYFKNTLKVNLSIDEMLEMMDEYALEKYRDVIALKNGVADCLAKLKNKGCSLNVLTASPHKMLDICLKRNGIIEMFDNVWSCDDFGLTKSDKKIYKSVANKIGVKENEIAFFDDNIEAIKTAHAAGLYTVGVYDTTGECFTQELMKTADSYINSFDEIEV